MEIRVNVPYLVKYLAIQFVATAVKTIAPTRSINHTQCWPIYKLNQRQCHQTVKIYNKIRVQKCVNQSILQMENHIYMEKYGELVNAQAGVQIQVDPCTNGDVKTDRLSLLSPAFLSISQERP